MNFFFFFRQPQIAIRYDHQPLQDHVSLKTRLKDYMDVLSPPLYCTREREDLWGIGWGYCDSDLNSVPPNTLKCLNVAIATIEKTVILLPSQKPQCFLFLKVRSSSSGYISSSTIHNHLLLEETQPCQIFWSLDCIGKMEHFLIPNKINQAFLKVTKN